MMGGSPAPPTPRVLVDQLVDLAPRVSPAASGAKARVLERLETVAIGVPRVLRRYHEALCYLQAYPDDPRVLVRVDQALAAWGARIGRLSRHARARLADSGIAGTVLSYPFGFAMARWLATRVPRQVRIVWGGAEEGERLEETLSLLVTRIEGEAFTEGGPGWRRWLRIAAGSRRLTELQLLIEVFERAHVEGPTRDWLFESLGLTLEWRLSATGPSRTHARLAWPSPLTVETNGYGRLLANRGRRQWRHHLAQTVRRALALRPAPPALAASLIEAARIAMATRARELFAFSYANPHDVLVADPERGLRIALIGLLPSQRLPLEAYYAFLVLRNGVPVSYGGGWYLFETLEIGFNVFESFRHGESSHLAGQVLRVYRQAFPMRAVVVDRYQIGDQNDEALRSGALYFYQRLGFRPTDPATRRLLEAERAKVARDPHYRSPRSVLRRLARSDLVLGLTRAAPPRRVRTGVLASAVSDHVARHFAGDRAAATRLAMARVGRLLGAWRQRAWPPAHAAFETFSLVLGLVPDLAQWPTTDRRALARIVEAKVGADERAYAGLMDAHHRLRGALAQLTRGADR
ncbi:MAG: hypothetical protein ACREKS_18590 [Candidatus Rokuibacteriota bacterium]